MSQIASAAPPTLTYLPPPVPELPPSLVHGALVLPGRDAIVDLLPKGKVIVEVGVAVGTFTHYALDVARPSLFIAIDSFKLHELNEFWGRKPEEYFGALSHYDWFCATFAAYIAAGQMRAMQGESTAMLAQLEDHSIDIVYVDADHRYDWVKADLEILAKKIKPDGYIIMDDYILVEHLNSNNLVGVIYATHEFMMERGWALHYLALQTNTYYQVVLRRSDQPRPGTVGVSYAEREVLLLREECARLRSSTSWRVTAPMRALSSMMRRRR